MDLAILGAFIGVGLAFMFYVLFKLNLELHRKGHRPKLGLGRPQSPSPAADRPQRPELKTAPDARVRTVELETKRP